MNTLLPRILDAAVVFESAQLVHFDTQMLLAPAFEPFAVEISEVARLPATWDPVVLRWPDGAIGFAMLPPEEGARAVAVVLTYTKARAVLESAAFLAARPLADNSIN